MRLAGASRGHVAEGTCDALLGGGPVDIADNLTIRFSGYLLPVEGDQLLASDPLHRSGVPGTTREVGPGGRRRRPISFWSTHRGS